MHSYQWNVTALSINLSIQKITSKVATFWKHVRKQLWNPSKITYYAQLETKSCRVGTLKTNCGDWKRSTKKFYSQATKMLLIFGCWTWAGQWNVLRNLFNSFCIKLRLRNYYIREHQDQTTRYRLLTGSIHDINCTFEDNICSREL